MACDAAFRDAVASLGYWYLARVPSDAQVFAGPPRFEIPPYGGRGRRPNKRRPSFPPKSVSSLAAEPGMVWQPVVLSEGAKGPIVAEVACLRVVQARGGLPHQGLWLLVRRDEDGRHQYWLSNAPPDVPIEEIVRAAVLRWPIEQCFQEGKGAVGMDHYELRPWQGWHRHML